MTKDKNERLRKAEENFLTRLLKQVAAPTFEVGQNSKEIFDNRMIIVEDNTGMTLEWLETRYSSLIRSLLITVVRVQIDLSEITSNDKFSEPLDESELMDFLKVNKEKIANQSELHKKRQLRDDYKEDLVNMVKCPCGCDDVSNVLIELDFPDQQSIRGATVQGAVCSSCKEQYILLSTVRAIEKIEEVILRNVTK